MAKQYSRPAFPDVNIDFSSMDNGFNDIMEDLEKAMGRSFRIPAHILEGEPKPKPEPIDSRFDILDL
jgi:hypothetical protein